MPAHSEQATASKPAVAPDRHAVTITLPAEAYEFYNDQATQDDRSLAKFLARKLQKSYEDTVSAQFGNAANAIAGSRLG